MRYRLWQTDKISRPELAAENLLISTTYCRESGSGASLAGLFQFIHFSSFSFRAESVIGFDIWSSIPASRHSLVTEENACAVTAIMGTRLLCISFSLRRISRVTSTPLISGRLRSMSIRAGACFSQAVSACAPDSARLCTSSSLSRLVNKSAISQYPSWNIRIRWPTKIKIHKNKNFTTSRCWCNIYT